LPESPENTRTTQFPFSKRYHENYLKRLNSRNHTIRDEAILGKYQPIEEKEEEEEDVVKKNTMQNRRKMSGGGIRIFIQPGGLGVIGNPEDLDFDESNTNEHEDDSYESYKTRNGKKSENFEVMTKFPTRFTDVGGYENIKQELFQCVDLLRNHTKYARFGVRVPKGLILEGSPGNGKTLLAKAFAGEAGVGFIAVSGSQFQEKYVGVGSTRIRELFELAKKNVPCVIFIDEIDAMGRKRSGDGESSSSERDSTLNELLVQLDGFSHSNGIFVIGATNRADLLDSALTRPGRIDKRIFLGMPDSVTRTKVLDIHLRGKPYDNATISVADLVDMSSGMSCAQIENLVNEAMLYALRENREIMTMNDIEKVMNKIMVGWQPNEHQFTTDIIDHIAIHEMGHVVMGMMSKHHANVSKVAINLYSPQSPGYTVFQPSVSNIHTREGLFEHLMILLSGRIAEEVFYNVSVTTGAINDFEEALKLAEKMVVYYGMGKNLIYPSNSDLYKQKIDDEVQSILNEAYTYAELIIRDYKDFIQITSEMLKHERVLRIEDLWVLFNNIDDLWVRFNQDEDTIIN
jgi:cell division protease FtsH